MARIKNLSKERDSRKKRKLLEILADNDVFATNITDPRDGFILHIFKQEEQDIVVSTICQEALSSTEFHAGSSAPELKSKRTVLLFNCPNEITRNSSEDIKQEMYRIDSYTEYMIEDIYSFPTDL